MKTLLITIGFILGGMLTSLAQAQVIPLTIDSALSSVEISIGGSASSSQMSGDATLDIQSASPPSGNAQIADLNLVLDEGLSFNLFLGLVSASTSPGDITLTMVTPGAPGTIAGGSFGQLANLLTLGGDLNVSDPLGFAGGNQTVDLSTITVNPFDFNSINVTESGGVVTVSNSFTINESVDLGGGMVPVVVDVTYVASGVVPTSSLLGDVNLDSVVNFFDIAPFISVLSTGVFQAEADCDLSGVINFFDIAPFIAILSSQ